MLNGVCADQVITYNSVSPIAMRNQVNEDANDEDKSVQCNGVNDV